MDTLYTFWDNITHSKNKRVHFLGLMNSATKVISTLNSVAPITALLKTDLRLLSLEATEAKGAISLRSASACLCWAGAPVGIQDFSLYSLLRNYFLFICKTQKNIKSSAFIMNLSGYR